METILVFKVSFVDLRFKNKYQNQNDSNKMDNRF